MNEDKTQPVDQEEVNSLVYHCLWDLAFSLPKGNWLKGRLDLYLPRLAEAMKEKKICEHCGQEL